MKRERMRWPDREITALKVHQWLDEWDAVKFDSKSFRKKPEPCFYQFSISAPELKALSGIYPRTTKERKRGAEDLGIQRRHEKDRSDKIHEFIHYGYPWSDLTKVKRESGQFDDLRKPGWLPTAIVVNILRPGDERFGRSVAQGDLVRVEANGEETACLKLPKNFHRNWRPTGVPPIEVIDGQHRLWAFEDHEFEGDFEFPVVAFHGLDISWQAYLFYVINIKPKKINASLAFDLYPLLRTEDWLEKFEGHVIYRETRAQELVDLLWSHTESPWHKRINMLGERGLKGYMVTQSAWIYSLLATYIRPWEGRRIQIGGLFGAKVGTHNQVLPWSRAEQAAFLMLVGQHLKQEVSACNKPWAKALRSIKPPELFKSDEDLAFSGPYTLINQDQGLRAILHITNDLCYVRADKLGLSDWGRGSSAGGDDAERIPAALKELKKQKVSEFLLEVAGVLATYDWRASGTPGLSEKESLLKAAFRGSGGYRDLRREVLRHVAEAGGEVASVAKGILNKLGYDKHAA